MEKEVEIRRRTIARQIQAALDKSGMSRSAFADALGKKPSVVTEWLKGNHNFTSDLLAQISSVLRTPITGVDTSSMVSGYDQESAIELNDPAGLTYSIDHITLQPLEYRSLEKQSKAIGVSLKDYAELILAREAHKSPAVDNDKEIQKTSAFLATCLGAWSGEEFDSVEDEMNKMRTFRKVVEL